jgi:hypothetical protein
LLAATPLDYGWGTLEDYAMARHGLLVVWSVTLLLIGSLPVSRATSAERAQPDKASAAAARLAVAEALQREVYGLPDERSALLEEAERQDPTSQPAKWQQGLVRTSDGEWLPPEDFKLGDKESKLLDSYHKLRAAAADTPAAHLSIANWCAERSLFGQERAHLHRVIALAPDHIEARHRLGHQRVGKVWLTAEEVKDEQERRVAHEASLAKYGEPLQEIVKGIQHRSQARQEIARKKLAEMNDSAAVPAIEAVLGYVDETCALAAIDKLGKMEGEQASLALCRFAVVWPSQVVHNAALAELRNRDRFEFVPALLDLLTLPLKSQYVATTLPNGRVGYQYAVVREGRNRRDVAVFNRQYITDMALMPIANEKSAKPGIINSTSQAATIARHEQMYRQFDALRDAARTNRMREAQLQEVNAVVAQANKRVIEVLAGATGQQFPTPDQWWGWWTQETDRLEISKYTTYSQKNQSKGHVRAYCYTYNPNNPSCFAAGTPVWTIDGLMPIEKIQIGDLVLSKDVETGELTYKPVLATTFRPPSPLVKFKVGSEPFLTSRGHLFWEPGTGWVQARRLAEGMVLHTADNPVLVSEVGQDAAQPTYNLVVADFNTYFVGNGKLFSHDVTEQEPTTVLVPGLAEH